MINNIMFKVRKKSILKNKSSNTHWVDYCLYPDKLENKNSVELLVDGVQAFPAMLKSIESAQKTILMDSYIFHDDIVGKMFSDKLCQKAQEGICVYLNVDSIGTFYVSDAFFDKMRKQGVNVLKYHPIAPWRRGFGILRRNHRKLLVVDGKIGFVGGLNIGKEWLACDSGGNSGDESKEEDEREGQGWHDIHVKVKGPVIRELSKLALSTWRIYEKVKLDESKFLPVLNSAGKTIVNIVGSKERKHRKIIRRSYFHAIKRARKYIYIANAYFLPGIGFRRALRNAVKRGVDVRIMVPQKGDIYPVQMASEALYEKLLKRGIKIFLWKDAVLHAKTAVIDDIWSTVGSFNIDRRSWTMNLEVNVNVIEEEFAIKLRDQFLHDQNKCEHLTIQKWRTRPLMQRFIEWFFFQFRKFM